MDPADQYDVDTNTFMLGFAAYLTENFGDRCPDFEPECMCCKLWALHDQVKEIVI